MLPFVLKTVQEPQLRLHLLRSENCCTQSGCAKLDVDVQTELYISRTNNLESADGSNPPYPPYQWGTYCENLSVLRRAKEAAYKAFTTFLQQASEPQPFLPIELLSQYQYQRYALILSVARSYELHEVFQNAEDATWTEQGRTIFEYGGFELSLSAKHFIQDATAYLVEPGKFTLFMRSVKNSEDRDSEIAPTTIRFYISRFIDLIGNAPPPIQLNAQEVIEAVEQEIVWSSAHGPGVRNNRPIGELLMFPPSNEPESDEVEEMTSCPECNGNVRRISESYFCLECDWDNLPPLKTF